MAMQPPLDVPTTRLDYAQEMHSLEPQQFYHLNLMSSHLFKPGLELLYVALLVTKDIELQTWANIQARKAQLLAYRLGKF